MTVIFFVGDTQVALCSMMATDKVNDKGERVSHIVDRSKRFAHVGLWVEGA